MDNKEIGSRIKSLREANGETQQDLADFLGVTQPGIEHYESGRNVPRDEMKRAIAEHYGTTVQKLFFE